MTPTDTRPDATPLSMTRGVGRETVWSVWSLSELTVMWCFWSAFYCFFNVCPGWDSGTHATFPDLITSGQASWNPNLMMAGTGWHGARSGVLRPGRTSWEGKDFMPNMHENSKWRTFGCSDSNTPSSPYRKNSARALSRISINQPIKIIWR